MSVVFLKEVVLKSYSRFLASLLTIVFGVTSLQSPAVAAAPPGSNFIITADDLKFIMDQIKISESHATKPTLNPQGVPTFTNGQPNVTAWTSPYVEGSVNPLDIPNPDLPWGLRQVDGRNNNLTLDVSGTPTRSEWGASDTPFPRMTNTKWRAAQNFPSSDLRTGGPTNITQGTYEDHSAGVNVTDESLREVSNLIADQSSCNPAAVAAASGNIQGWTPCGLLANIVSAVADGSKITYTTDTVDAIGNGELAVVTGITPAHLNASGTATKTGPTTFTISKATTDVSAYASGGWLTSDRTPSPTDKARYKTDQSILNVAPNAGRTSPYTGIFVIFGQFFDHGLDLVGKTNSEMVLVPLKKDDPLYTTGSQSNFMAMNRTILGPNAPVGTDTPAGENYTTPYIDQNQTYTSHPSHQVFLREYVSQSRPTATGTKGIPMPTGKFLDGAAGGLATWSDIKGQAATQLGINLRDSDIADVPLLLTNEFGRFLPGPNGLPLIAVKPTGAGPEVLPVFLEGNLTNPVATSGNAPANITNAAGQIVIAAGSPYTAVLTGHHFITDVNHCAVPGSSARETGDCQTTYPTETWDGTLNYSPSLLGQHFMTGDGRGNENIALSAIHSVFHAEHNRLIDDPNSPALGYKSVITTQALTLGNAARRTYVQDWVTETIPGNATVSFVGTSPRYTVGAVVTPLTWNGERLFQAARFANEMQYQHLVFAEFVRMVEPAVAPFAGYDINTRADIFAEFAHAVYRYGHSQLTNEVTRVSPSQQDYSLPLFEAFLSPDKYFDGPTGAQLGNTAAAGGILQGMSNQVGNDIDEFVTSDLRNTLLGIPLDLATLNLGRGRDTGTASLNSVRQDLNMKPYTSWYDFGAAMEHPESLSNYIAAYGTDPSITSETTIVGKRAAAQRLLVAASNGVPSAEAFIYGTGGTATGVDDMDLWVGGLGEKKGVCLAAACPLLGATFSHIFQKQMEALQAGDRLYYLARIAGLNLGVQVEGNTLSEMIMRNTDATNLPALVFGAADYSTQLSSSTPCATAASVDLRTGLVATITKTIQALNCRIEYSGAARKDVVWGGTAGNDNMLSGNGDDTMRGNAGNDIVNGGDGNNQLYGGDGNDVVIDSGNSSSIGVLNGGSGNDILLPGRGLKGNLPGDGNDIVIADIDGIVASMATGNDFAIGAFTGADVLDGTDGNDWLEGLGGTDSLNGDVLGLFGIPTVSSGRDALWGGKMDDVLDGGGLSDVIADGDGADSLSGGFGWDWFIGQGAVNATSWDGQCGNRVALQPVGAPGVVQCPAGFVDAFPDTVEGMSGEYHNDYLRGDDTNSYLAIPNVAGSSEDLIGSDFYNTDGTVIPGLASILRITQPANNATVITRTGNVILGGLGSDELMGGGGDDLLDGDAYFISQLQVPVPGTNSTTLISSLSDPVTGLVNGSAVTRAYSVWLSDGSIDPSALIEKRRVVEPGVTVTGASSEAVPGVSGAFNYTYTTNQTHGFYVGQKLNIALVGGNYNNASATVTAVPNNTTFVVRATSSEVTVGGALGTASPVGTVSPGVDTATFILSPADYSYTENADGSLTVTQVTAPLAGGSPTDGTDTLRGIEQLKFLNSAGNGVAQTVSLANGVRPSAPINTAVNSTSGTAATLSWGVPLQPSTVLAGPITGYTALASSATQIPVTTVTGNGNRLRYTSSITHGLAVGQSVTITGFTNAGFNQVLGTISAVNAGARTFDIVSNLQATETPGTPAAAVSYLACPVALNAAARSCAFTGLAANTSYSFTVRANTDPARVTQGGVFSTPVTLRSGSPSVPNAVSAVVASATSVAVSWTAPTFAGIAPTTYQVNVVDNLGTPVVNQCVGISALTCTVTGLTTNTAYSFTVVATNASGSSNATAPVTRTPVWASEPSTPLNMSASLTGSNQFTVNWTASSYQGPPNTAIDYYQVTASIGNVVAQTCRVNADQPLTCVFSGLTSGTPYNVSLIAHNTNGAGFNSVAATTSITPLLNVPPAAPSSQAVSPTTGSNTSLSASWVAPTVVGSTPLVGFTVNAYTAASGGTAVATCGGTDPAMVSCNLTGLNQGTKYWVTIVANNQLGSSAEPTPRTMTVITTGANLTTSTIASSATSLVEDGFSTSTITVSLKDSTGAALTNDGGSIGGGLALSASIGTLTNPVYVSNGQWTATYTAPASTSPSATISATSGSGSFVNSLNLPLTVISMENSTITAGTTTLVANGTGFTTLTIQLKDGNGTNLTTAGTLSLGVIATNGEISNVAYVSNGQWTARYRAATVSGPDTINVQLGGRFLAQPLVMTLLSSSASPATSQISATPSAVTADGVTPVTVTLSLKDALGATFNGTPETLAVVPSCSGACSANPGTVGAISRGVNPGEYTAIYTPAIEGGTVTLTPSIGGLAFTGSRSGVTATVSLAAISLSQSTITANAIELIGNGSSTTKILVQLKDGNQVNIPTSGGLVTFSATCMTTCTDGPGTFSGSFVSKGNGLWEATYVTPNGTGQVQISAKNNGRDLVNSTSILLKAPGIDFTKSTISSDVTSLTADGSSTARLTVVLRDSLGDLYVGSRGTVGISISGAAGTIQNLVASGASSYTADYVSPTSGSTVTLTPSVDSVPFAGGTSSSVTIALKEASVTRSTITAQASVLSSTGSTTTTIDVQLLDSSGNALATNGGTLTFGPTTYGTLGQATYQSSGLWRVIYTASSTPGTDVIRASINGRLISATESITVTDTLPSAANSTITVNKSEMLADGASQATVTLVVRNQNGELYTGSLPKIILSLNAGNSGTLGSLNSSGPGTFEATYTAPAAANAVSKVFVYASIDGTQLSTPGTINLSRASAVFTTMTSTSFVLAPGAQSNIDVRLFDALGAPISSDAAVVQLTAACASTCAQGLFGSIGVPVYQTGTPGTYRAVFTAPSGIATTLITGTINGTVMTNRVTIDTTPTGIAPLVQNPGLVPNQVASSIGFGTVAKSVALSDKDVTLDLKLGDNTPFGESLTDLQLAAVDVELEDNKGNRTRATYDRSTKKWKLKYRTPATTTSSGEEVKFKVMVNEVAVGAIADPAMMIYPAGVDFTQSAIVTETGSLVADGSSTSTITVHVRNALGELIDVPSLELDVKAGKISSPSKVIGFPGLWTAVYTAPVNPLSHQVRITASVGSGNLVNSATMDLVAPSATRSTISANTHSLQANGTTPVGISVQLLDDSGNAITTSGGTVTLSTRNGTIRDVAYSRTSGLWTGTYIAGVVSGNVDVVAAVNGVPLANKVTLNLTPLTMAKKAKKAAVSVAAMTGVPVPFQATVKISVAKKLKSTCSVAGKTLVIGKKSGTCTMTIAVTPKGSKKTTTYKRSIVVQ